MVQVSTQYEEKLSLTAVGFAVTWKQSSNIPVIITVNDVNLHVRWPSGSLDFTPLAEKTQISHSTVLIDTKSETNNILRFTVGDQTCFLNDSLPIT